MDWDGKGIWIGCIREGDWFKQVCPVRAKSLQRAGQKLVADVRKVCGGRNGVEVELVMRRDGCKDLKDLQGMRFKKGGYTFKASQIRKGLSYAVILSKLNANEEKEQQRTINSQSRQIQTEQPRQKTYSEQQKHNEPSIGIPSLGLFDTTNPAYDPVEEEFRRRMQKKKKKRGPRL